MNTESFKRRVSVEPGGCWIWTGFKVTHGYGGLMVDGSQCLAHRVSFELHKGKIPAGHHVHHACGVKCCVNPEHLVALSPLDHAKTMPHTNKTHCKHGHSLEGCYLSKRSDGGISRRCKPCHDARVRGNDLKRGKYKQ